MALTTNNTRAKINFGQLVNEITDDPKVAPNDILKPEKTHNEDNLLPKKEEEAQINTDIKTVDTTTETTERSSLSKQLAAQRKKSRGCPKTIYFEEDTYEYVMSIANRYNIRISQVINTIIRDVKKHEDLQE